MKSKLHKIYVKLLVLLGRAVDVGAEDKFPSGDLSNFTPYNFTFRGRAFVSMESLLQGIKFESIEKQNKVFNLIRVAAKRKGKKAKWYLSQTLYWQGSPLKRDSQEYQLFLKEAFAALSENLEFQKALRATKHKRLFHTIGKSETTRTVLTENEFCNILTELREKLQQQTNLI